MRMLGKCKVAKRSPFAICEVDKYFMVLVIKYFVVRCSFVRMLSSIFLVNFKTMSG
jgi:hypothetical protein